MCYFGERNLLLYSRFYFILFGDLSMFSYTHSDKRIRQLNENSVILEVNDLQTDKGCGMPKYQVSCLRS